MGITSLQITQVLQKDFCRWIPLLPYTGNPCDGGVPKTWCLTALMLRLSLLNWRTTEELRGALWLAHVSGCIMYDACIRKMMIPTILQLPEKKKKVLKPHYLDTAIHLQQNPKAQSTAVETVVILVSNSRCCYKGHHQWQDENMLFFTRTILQTAKLFFCQ